MQTRARVSSTTSSALICPKTRSSARTGRALLQGEGQDDGVEADHAVLLARDVEEVSLDLFRILLEGDHALDGRHLAEGIGALVEAVAAAHDFGIADGRAFRAMHAHIGGVWPP